MRHHQQLVNTEHALQLVIQGIDKGITNDILAMEIRQALHHLGEITGEITTDDLLDNIFSKFCIGKWYLKLTLIQKHKPAKIKLDLNWLML